MLRKAAVQPSSATIKVNIWPKTVPVQENLGVGWEDVIVGLSRGGRRDDLESNNECLYLDLLQVMSAHMEALSCLE
jgi:hypothetical protein